MFADVFRPQRFVATPLIAFDQGPESTKCTTQEIELQLMIFVCRGLPRNTIAIISGPWASARTRFNAGQIDWFMPEVMFD